MREARPPDWPERFISAYATSHRCEDFAETWAHYLHIIDTLEMAWAFNMNVHPRVEGGGGLDAAADFDPYASPNFSRVIDTWIPLCNALNCLNRTMGQVDLYPFLLPPHVMIKLRAIHDLVHANERVTLEDA
jgi:hypothetical protein